MRPPTRGVIKKIKKKTYIFLLGVSNMKNKFNFWNDTKNISFQGKNTIKYATTQQRGAAASSWISSNSAAVSPGYTFIHDACFLFFFTTDIIIFHREIGFCTTCRHHASRRAMTTSCVSAFRRRARERAGGRTERAGRWTWRGRCRPRPYFFFSPRKSKCPLPSDYYRLRVRRRDGGRPKGKNPGLDWPLQGCARPTLKCPRRAQCVCVRVYGAPLDGELFNARVVFTVESACFQLTGPRVVVPRRRRGGM